ncbi:MAG: VIT domain-containing protein [Kofleriaceae bacterium]
MQKLSWVVLLVVGCSSPAPEAVVAPPPTPAPAVLQTHRPEFHREPVAPWSLTASDGSGLQLVSVEAKAVIEGPLAFTELHLRFHNPEDRVREGTFSITLPSRATVSRFAMVEHGRTKEAEVVAKALARRAYDDALHRGVDPAILEKAAGNQFSARVYPIPANGSKDLVISYSQELATTGYLLPLAGLPTIDDVSVTLDATRPDGTHRKSGLHETHWQPDHDFVANVVTPAAVATGDLVAGTFEVSPVGAAAVDRPTALTVLVDTSASRGLGFPRYLDGVRTLVGALAWQYDGLVVDVIAFDQETHPIYRGPAKDFGVAQVTAFTERRAAGASDLSQAIAADKATSRIAIVTDGVVTAGLEGKALAALLAKRERVDVILAGGIRDEHVATLLVRAGTRPGDTFDLDDDLDATARGLGEVVQVDVPIEVAGATWFAPHQVASLRAGTQVMVFARTDTASRSFTVTIGGSSHAIGVMPATPALLERAAARVEIDELEVALGTATTEVQRATLRKQIETTSIASRVVSTQATMLMLDSDEDYARYGIDRQALADILVVGPNGLEQQHRTFVASKDRRPPRLTRKEALALGTLGSARYSTSGYGMGGGGSGWGASSYGMMSSRVAAVPTISIGQANVTGSLDKAFIRRYIRRHFEKITNCYNHELLARPHLHGSVQTRFTIGPAGTTSAVTAEGFDDKVASCVKGVIEHIEFPPVSGSTIIVSYPFEFRTAETPEDAPDPIAAVLALPAVTSTSPAIAASPSPGAIVTPPAVSPAIVAPAPTATPVAAPPAIVSSHRDEPAPIVTPAGPPDPTFGPRLDALDGKLASVMRMIAKKDVKAALGFAQSWRDEQPADVLALIGLGEAFEASGDPAAAARAYGSLIDLYPSQADYRRFAGERLERLGAIARKLAIDTYRRAVVDRPDQVTGHRLFAYALLRNGEYGAAFTAILAAVDEPAIDGRYLGAKDVFARDAGMIATAYLAHGGDRDRVAKALAKRELVAVTERSLRFILYWETDANDVDLHVHDSKGGHAWYAHKDLESGGALYADITTGFGPECFEIRGEPTAGPYDLGVHYYAEGPMGYGMGLLQIVRFDGASFTFEDRPYMIMKNKAYVSLGKT